MILEQIVGNSHSVFLDTNTNYRYEIEWSIKEENWILIFLFYANNTIVDNTVYNKLFIIKKSDITDHFKYRKILCHLKHSHNAQLEDIEKLVNSCLSDYEFVMNQMRATFRCILTKENKIVLNHETFLYELFSVLESELLFNYNDIIKSQSK